MFVLMHVWIYRNVTILLIMWWFLSTCYSQDGGLFQRSNRSDVDLLSKQNTSIYKNNSKNHTVTDITSFFNFMFNFRCTISTKTTAKRTTWVSQYHISLWRAFLESFWALWNFGRHDPKYRATWLYISGDMTLVSGDMTSGEMTFRRLDRNPLRDLWRLRRSPDASRPKKLAPLAKKRVKLDSAVVSMVFQELCHIFSHFSWL